MSDDMPTTPAAKAEAPDTQRKPRPREPRKPRKKAAASAGADPSLFSAPIQRYFFPCNREDALAFLGSLFVSADFILDSVSLPLQPEGVALLTEGLNETEQELLRAGRRERFPLLIEVSSSAAQARPRSV